MSILDELKKQAQEKNSQGAQNQSKTLQNYELNWHLLAPKAQLIFNYLKELADTFSVDTRLLKGLSTTAGANEHEVRRLAVAAYNAGPGRVARAQEMVRAQGGDPAHYDAIAPYLPRETQMYVRRVERYAAEFRGSHLA